MIRAERSGNKLKVLLVDAEADGVSGVVGARCAKWG